MTLVSRKNTMADNKMIRNSEVEAAEPKPMLPASTSLFLIILLSAIVFLRLTKVKLSEPA